MKLSIVVPCYNEEDNINVFFDRMRSSLSDMEDFEFEIIFIDDGSSDATWKNQCQLADKENFIKCIKLSRNFGHQIAVCAGLDQAQGDFIAIIDADLQDPPEVIPEMLAKAESGFDVVYGKRKKRDGETIFKKLTSYLYYRGLSFLTEVDIPNDTGDFRIISKRVLETFKKMPEKHKYIRGMISWVGFQQTPFEYSRQTRHAGSTGYTLRKMIMLGLDGISSFSIKPLRIAMVFSFLAAILSILFFSLAVFEWSQGYTIRGWTSLIAIVCLIGSANLFVLGIIGEYLGKMVMETKDRPLYVIDQIINDKI
jgi:glycosyltransferase involved in cell wall biosynthesis